MTTTVRATLDRIVDGEDAVFLVDGEEGVTDELVVDIDELDERGRAEGSIHEITLTETAVEDISLLEAETEERREGAQDRLDRLSKSLGDSSADDE